MVRNIASRKWRNVEWFGGRIKQEFLKGDVYEDMDYLAILAEDYFKTKD